MALPPFEVGAARLIVALPRPALIEVIVGEPGATTLAAVTPKVSVTCAAGLKLALPPCWAAIIQVPTATPVTVLPEIVQAPVDKLLKLTGKPEVAVALTVPVPPTTTLGAGPKAMLWLDKALSKRADSVFAEFIVKRQVGVVPLHAPPHPVKALPVAGVALSVTVLSLL
jgi:hypothetical protein